MDRHYISEEAFEKIYMFLSSEKGVYCKDREKTKNFLESVYFIMRTGAQWIELPEYYGLYCYVPLKLSLLSLNHLALI
jgi:hypothetical protein